MPISDIWKRLHASQTEDKRVSAISESSNEKPNETGTDLVESQVQSHDAAAFAKIRAIESMRSWNGRYILYAGELDNSTLSTYRNYATSDFNKLSMLASLNTAASIISAVFKPPIAKFSDVLGRAEAYLFTVCCYIISYILCASSKNFNTYAGGVVLYAIGQSGVTVLNAILISDLTSMRWRAFSYNILYLPFLIVPWVSAFIIESVVNGIGWRWGIGMFAILMPVCASVIIITLAVFQSRARHSGLLTKEHLTLFNFCSRIDLGGTILLSGGFALLLIPITIAATTTSRWQTPWVDALIALGIVALLALYPYEKYIANHPVVPTRYFRVLAIVASVCLACIDNIGFGATHTYLYAWSTVSRGFSPRNAQFLMYTNGVMQNLTGMAIGLVIYRIRSYKWILVAGAVIRLVGYGIMIRLRTNDSSIAELFIVQLVQGLGSGIIETIVIVASQIVVPHVELAQVTSLIMLSAFLGNGIGSAIAGGIYTDTLRERLRVRLGEGVSEGQLDKLYNSITGALSDWGTAERDAVNLAYSDVMGYITIAAVGIAVPVVILAFFVPNNKLGYVWILLIGFLSPMLTWSRDGHNLTQDTHTTDPSTVDSVEKEAK